MSATALRAGFDPNQPRDQGGEDGGEWVKAGGGGGVSGEYSKAFSNTPDADSPVTAAANEASEELAQLGLSLPEGMPKIPLEEATTIKAMAQLRMVGSDPVGIEVLVNDDPETFNEMTSNIHHEFGHYLDATLLKTEASGAKFASEARGSTVGPVMDAIDRSEAGQRIDFMSADPDAFSVKVHYMANITKEYPIDYERVTYLNRPEEKFARAYEQYVSTNAGKRLDRYAKGAALGFDDVEMGAGDREKAFYGWYWKEDDFKPIATEFDAMFRRLGWSKNSSPKG